MLFFAMCYYVLFDSEVPLKGTGILLSARDSPPWRTTDGSLKGASLVSFSVGVVSAQPDGVLSVFICSFTWRHHTGGATLLSPVIALGNSSQFL